MEVVFDSKKLAKQCASDKSRSRTFGAERAKKLRMRITALNGATSMEDLRNVAGKFHNLTANRAGQISASLDGSYRLIFEPVLEDDQSDGPMPEWSQITKVRILEIGDYHGA